MNNFKKVIRFLVSSFQMPDISNDSQILQRPHAYFQLSKKLLEENNTKRLKTGFPEKNMYVSGVAQRIVNHAQHYFTVQDHGSE